MRSRCRRGKCLRGVEECLEIVKQPLDRGQGQRRDRRLHATRRDADVPTPSRSQHPPIWFAANNDAAVRRAARLGDAWFVNPHATMTQHHAPDGPIHREGARPSLGKPLPRVRPLHQGDLLRGRTGRRPWSWPGHISVRSTVRTRRGARTPCCPTVTPFASRSRRSSAIASCWAARRNAMSSFARAGKRSAPTLLFFRTHWLGMPLAHALASMRLMSDELPPALRQVKG